MERSIATARLGRSRAYSKDVAPGRSTLRTVFRDTIIPRDLLDRLALDEVLTI